MTIRYEANPPKILQDGDNKIPLKRFVERITSISKKCDAIHITEDVLGYQRASPLAVAEIVRDVIPKTPVTVSLRVRDKTEREISEAVERYVALRCSGILVLMGDPSRTGTPDSGQVPSRTITRLREQGVDSRIDLYLSIPNVPNPSTIYKKTQVAPKGFMTQVVCDIGQVRSLAESLRGFDVIPIILFPSEKNQMAAKFLGMNLAHDGQGFEGFVREAHRITGDVLITSPGDFGGLERFLQGMS